MMRHETAFSARCRLVREAVQALPPKERRVMMRYCGLDGPAQTMPDIARHLKVTVQRVSQLKVKSFARLRANPEFMALAHEMRAA